VAGDPDLKTSLVIARTLLENGGDILEIGVPFSDPSADGPTIMAADARALANGVSIVMPSHLVRDLRTETDKPILFLLYYNTIVQMGLDLFFTTCHEVGVDGVIIPDLPAEEQDDISGVDTRISRGITLKPCRSFLVDCYDKTYCGAERNYRNACHEVVL